MGCLREVDTRQRLVTLMQRLPENLQARWRKKAVSARDEDGVYPGITTFLDFLESVAREASDPIFGIKVQTTSSEKNN